MQLYNVQKQWRKIKVFKNQFLNHIGMKLAIMEMLQDA